MKKLALIVLTVIYTLAIFGAVPAAGYCCEKSVFTSNSSNCCDEPGGAKIQTQHIAVSGFHFSSRVFAAVQPVAASFELPPVQPIFLVSDVHARPGVQRSVPVYILHCVYRI